MPFILLPDSTPAQALQWSKETGVLVDEIIALNEKLKTLHAEALKQPQRQRLDSDVGETPMAGPIQTAQAELDATFDELKKYYPAKGGRRRTRSRRTRRHH
jgi:hypothetical protein